LSQKGADGGVVLAPGATVPPREPSQKIRVPAVDGKGNPLLDDAGKAIYTDTLAYPSQMGAQGDESASGLPANPELQTIEDELSEAMQQWNGGQRYGGFLNAFPNYWKNRIADLQKRRDEILKKSGGGGGASLSPAQQVTQTEAALKAKGVTITPELQAEIRRRAGM